MELYFHEVDRGVMVVAVDGGLDKTTLPAFTEQVDRIVDAGLSKLILDAERLTYLSSAAIARLLLLHRRMKERGGEVKLANLHGPVFDVLRFTKIDQVLGVYENVDLARASFDPSSN